MEVLRKSRRRWARSARQTAGGKAMSFYECGAPLAMGTFLRIVTLYPDYSLARNQVRPWHSSPKSTRSATKAPTRPTRSAFRHYNADENGRRQDDEGASALRRGLLAHHARHGRRSVRPRLRTSGPGRTAPTPSRWPIKRVRVAFEFMEKLGAPFYCFHDRDVAPEGKNLARDQRQPRQGRRRCSKEEQQRTGIKLLWGTANLFSNPRFVHGAATSLQRRRLRLRRGPGQEGHRGDAASSAASTTSSGAAARATRTSTTPT